MIVLNSISKEIEQITALTLLISTLCNRLRWLLVFFIGSNALQLPAQENEAKRKTVSDLRVRADAGIADAQCHLGDCYHFGEGVAKDDVEAMKWWRKAAEQNQSHAQVNLGTGYLTGQGVEKDEVEAVRWLRRAADQNVTRAQVNLGMCYAHGRGVAKDELEAINLFRKAGESGEVGGFNNLAWILATSENPAVRNGPNAVFFAEKAVAGTNRKNPTNLDTLAAAYAEANEFEKAVKTEQEAIALCHTKAEKDAFKTRLKLYEAKVPYRNKE